MSRKRSHWRESDVEKFERFIYDNGLENDIEQYSQYHWRILNKIDVWPGVKKYWKIGSSGGSVQYQHLQELKKAIYGTTIKGHIEEGEHTTKAQARLED